MRVVKENIYLLFEEVFPTENLTWFIDTSFPQGEEKKFTLVMKREKANVDFGMQKKITFSLGHSLHLRCFPAVSQKQAVDSREPQMEKAQCKSIPTIQKQQVLVKCHFHQEAIPDLLVTVGTLPLQPNDTCTLTITALNMLPGYYLLSSLSKPSNRSSTRCTQIYACHPTFPSHHPISHKPLLLQAHHSAINHS
ncbi:T-cell surface protein tactile [Manis javanica]|nr:T-cell surface protein tactile [Manis javanica]